MDIHITHTHTATHKATLLEPATMADALLHDLDWHTDDHAQHVDTVLQQMQKLGERAGQKIDTAYWNTALLDETCPANDVEYDIVWMAWLAQRARLSPDCQRDTPHVAVLARRLETFNGKKKQRPIYLSQALTYVTCAGYMDQSFGDAPPSPTRRAVRDNCLVLATHADACDFFELDVAEGATCRLCARSGCIYLRARRAPRRARCSRPCLPGCCAKSPRPGACARYAC